MKRLLVLVPLLAWTIPAFGGPDMLRNGGFEERDTKQWNMPRYWKTEGDASPLEFSSEHRHGTAAALLVGDGKTHMWRQEVVPQTRAFTLSAFVKADGVKISDSEEHASLYGHILYKNRPYSDARHFYVEIEPGTYDWKRISVSATASGDAEIEKVLVTVTGKFSAGRILFDNVQLREAESITPVALLQRKVADLRSNLERVSGLDESVASARQHLDAADKLLAGGESQLQPASEQWVKAAEAVSHKAWAAMFPDAMTDRPVEAQMIYHGIAQTKEGCDRYLDIIEKTGCNGVFHSLGSWKNVVHRSEIVPTAPGWEKFDALEYSIAEARKRGIKTFAYYAAFYGTNDPAGGPNGLYEKHPDWFAKGPNPNMPTFPDPANPEVVEYTVKVFTELASKYDLDGIGLDYIRYPTPSSLNYDENNRRQIKERYGFDILEGDVWKDAEKWAKIREYRAEKVGIVVKRVREAVKKVKPNMTVMACLSSYPERAPDYAQNWPKSAYLLDYASPMNYDDISADLDLLAKQRDIFASHQARYIPAIGGMPEVHESWPISRWAERVAIQRKNGCDGIIIYRMGGFDPAVAAFFGNGPFHAKTAFPESLKK